MVFFFEQSLKYTLCNNRSEANLKNLGLYRMCIWFHCIPQAKHIEEVCKASETMSKTSEEKIIQKMENALKNREEHFKALQERLKDHVRLLVLC